jgi:hypothetical protein
MDWFILLFLLPLILMPVVFLCGFAGCGLDVVGKGPAASKPADLKAVATGPSQVGLTWKDAPGYQYSIERGKSGDPILPIGQTAPTTSFTDNTPTEATTYLYRVVQTVGGTSYQSSDPASVTTFPAKPTNLTATVIADISLDPGIPAPPPRIELKWTNNSARADGFILQYRAGTSGPFLDLPQSIVPAPGPSTATFTHTGVAASTTYQYQVFAFIDGFDSIGNPLQVRSEPAAIAAATTPATPPVWKTILQLAINQNAGANPNDCIVQRLKGPFPFGGSKVRLTLRGPATGSIVIQRVYISQAAAAGSEYNSAADLTKILDLPAVTIAANAVQVLGPTDYALDPAKDLIVAFDLGSPASGRRGDRPGSAYFVHSNVDDAAKQVRTATGYTKVADVVYLLEKIEVLAPGP